VSALGLVVAELPALPLHTAGKYVAAAYIVLFLVVLIYVAIMGIRLSHLERDLGELLSLTASSPEEEHPAEAGPDTSVGSAEQQSDVQRESTPA
jgi:hypothetical protein